MKIGLCSYSYRWAIGTKQFRPRSPMGVTEFVLKAHSLGVKVVHIADNLPLPSLEEDYLWNLKSISKEKGLFLELGMRGTDPNLIESMIQACEAAGSHVLRIVTSPHAAVAGEVVTSPSDKELDAIIQIIKSASRDAEKAGVSLAVENHSGIGSQTLLRLVDAIDRPNVGICLDTANSVSCLEDPLYTVTLLSPRCVTVHLKDFQIITRYPGPGFEMVGTPIGKGRLPLQKVLAILKKNCRYAALNVEIFPGMKDDEEETLEAEDMAVRESIDALRQHVEKLQGQSALENFD
jgi:sugar phosphate isomerase/epimerase